MPTNDDTESVESEVSDENEKENANPTTNDDTESVESEFSDEKEKENANPNSRYVVIYFRRKAYVFFTFLKINVKTLCNKKSVF